MPTARAVLVAIGNELLNGEVQDTNLYRLIGRLTRRGVTVQQAAMVRDDPADIAALLCHLLAAAPEVMILSGGLGPTGDDLTLSALAQALALPLVEDATARALVEQQYQQLLARGYLLQWGPETARQKMARLPQGATPLPNPVGTAPGVRLEHGPTLIFCLPGVPAELEAIFSAWVEPELLHRFGPSSWVEAALIAHCDDEAALADPLREVAARHPAVYLKSLARPFPAAHVEGVRVVAAVRAETEAAGQAQVAQTLADLEQCLDQAGIPVERV